MGSHEIIWWTAGGLGLFVAYVLAVAAIAHVIGQRRSPEGTIAWLLVILLLPLLGVPLYLLLGGRKRSRAARRKGDLCLLGDQDVLAGRQTTELDRLLRAYGVPGATRGNTLHACVDGQDTYARLADLIDRARHHIHLATFIFEPDEVGRDILARLAARAQRGIQVRLLMDDVGSLWTTRRFLAPLRRAGGRTAFFTPLLSRPFQGRTNLRNHRKIVVADDRRALAGGANIARQYIGPTAHARRWRDFSFVIEGPAARQYAELFRNDWAFASGERLAPLAPAAPAPPTEDDGAVLQVVPSGPDCPGDALLDAILSVVYAARRRLWIVSPYFVPEESLRQALGVAARRGVDLRIVVPYRSDHRVLDLARGPYLRDLQEAGAQIVLFRRGMLHAKLLVADDHVAMAGSANMDRRSLLLNYEVAVFAYSPREIQAIADYIGTLLSSTVTGVEPPTLPQGLAESVIRLLAPLL